MRGSWEEEAAAMVAGVVRSVLEPAPPEASKPEEALAAVVDRPRPGVGEPSSSYILPVVESYFTFCTLDLFAESGEGKK